MLRVVAIGLVGWLGSTTFAQESDAGAGEIESFENASPSLTTVAELEPETNEFVQRVQVHGNVRGDTGLDTRFDSPRNVPLAENVFEARVRTSVSVDVKVSNRVRLVLEGRAQLRFATQRSFDRAKAFFEPMLGEAYVDLYTEKVDFRVGQQRIALGANTALAAADALNPRDLRESLMQGEPDDFILPSFALRAQGELGGGAVSWLVAYAPFFQPNRLFVFGQDEALVQPGLGVGFDNRRIDPSIEDFIHDRILETKRPVPFAGDVAIRAVSTGRFKVGGSWVWFNEKLPRVTVDPEVASLARAQAAGRPLDSATALSVNNRFQAGESLGQGVYWRQHVFALEGSTLIDTAQLDVDVSFSPRQTFVDPSFAPLDKAVVSWVVGVSQAEVSSVQYSVNYVGMAIPNIAANQQLLFVEPATAVGGARTGFFHLFMGTVAVPVWQRRFELQLRAGFEPIQRSVALGPRVTFQGIDNLKIWLAAEVYEGSAWSPFGYFSRNDKVVLGARYDVF